AVNVTGTLTIAPNGQFNLGLGSGNSLLDSADVGALSNAGSVFIGQGAFLKIRTVVSVIPAGANWVINGGIGYASGPFCCIPGFSGLTTVNGSLTIGNYMNLP